MEMLTQLVVHGATSCLHHVFYVITVCCHCEVGTWSCHVMSAWHPCEVIYVMSTQGWCGWCCLLWGDSMTWPRGSTITVQVFSPHCVVCKQAWISERNLVLGCFSAGKGNKISCQTCCEGQDNMLCKVLPLCTKGLFPGTENGGFWTEWEWFLSPKFRSCNFWLISYPLFLMGLLLPIPALLLVSCFSSIGGMPILLRGLKISVGLSTDRVVLVLQWRPSYAEVVVLWHCTRMCHQADFFASKAVGSSVNMELHQHTSRIGS